MDAAVAIAIVGVAGTLLGVALQAWLQRKSTLRERLRQNRVEVYSDFAAALMDYRRTQLERWHQPGDEVREIEARKARATAWHHLYRVQLLADHPGVYDRAHVALDSTSALTSIPRHEPIGGPADDVRDLVNDFISAARSEVHGGRIHKPASSSPDRREAQSLSEGSDEGLDSPGRDSYP